jgi:hypothetical protein
MAWKLQLQDLARAALRVLVIERALEPASQLLGRTTIFGRPRSGLSDDISGVVQHATNSVRSRVEETAQNLFSTNAYTWLQMHTWSSLMQIKDSMDTDIASIVDERHLAIAKRIRDQYSTIIAGLQNYIRTCVDNALHALPYPVRQNEIDNDRRAYVSKGADYRDIIRIVTNLSDEQVLLVPFFWTRLVEEIHDGEVFFRWTSSDLEHCLGDSIFEFTTELHHVVAEGIFPTLQVRSLQGFVFDTQQFHNELRDRIAMLLRDWVPLSGVLEAPLHRTTHLSLGLVEDEFKFLPLWAGGLDDGTGAVFDDMTVPDTDMGPSQPGPAFVTGRTLAASSTADSDLTIVGGGMSVQAIASGTSDSFVNVSSSSVDDINDDLEDFGIIDIDDEAFSEGVISDNTSEY